MSTRAETHGLETLDDLSENKSAAVTISLKEQVAVFSWCFSKFNGMVEIANPQNQNQRTVTSKLVSIALPVTNKYTASA